MEGQGLDKAKATYGELMEAFIAVMTPEKGRRLVDPYDPKQNLTLRARSYLDRKSVV